jgi:hypothetical protein
MTATIAQAIDEIHGIFKTAWDADSSSQNVPVLYSDVSDEPPVSGAWARITISHSSSFQATLSSDSGTRRYRRVGTVTVEVYTPTGGGRVLSTTLSTIAKNAFEGVTTAPGQVIFRNARLIEVGQEGNKYHVNILADFEYDEVK